MLKKKIAHIEKSDISYPIYQRTHVLSPQIYSRICLLANFHKYLSPKAHPHGFKILTLTYAES